LREFGFLPSGLQLLNLERTEYGVLSALNLSGVQEEIELIGDLNDLVLSLSRAGGDCHKQYPHDGARMNRRIH
jgi:hypothetical protein